MPELEIQALRRIYDALSRWDVEGFENDVTHDFELILPETVPWGGTRHGRTAWTHTRPSSGITSRGSGRTRMTS
jgi:ketosteroid isomerase-like protein